MGLWQRAMGHRIAYLWIAVILWWYLQRTYGCDEVTDLRHVRCVGQVTPPGFQVRLPGCLTPCDVPNGLKTTTGRCDFEDVDECVLKVDNCSVNSYCVNSVGSYSCQCLPGYQAQGSICDDINECISGLHNCTINEICINSDGSFSCECRSGFSWDGQQCIDIDECAEGLHHCGSHSYCDNNNGSYSCRCLNGYSWNGFNCEDVDECDIGRHNCVLNSNCINTEGDYFCECNAGYENDGTSCVDVDECAANLHNCNTGMSCTNTEGSFTCECDIDYSWIENQCVANPYRSDARCGGHYIAPNGEVAICNKDSVFHCCSATYWCGRTDAHCHCSTCINYRELSR